MQVDANLLQVAHTDVRLVARIQDCPRCSRPFYSTIYDLCKLTVGQMPLWCRGSQP